VFAVLFLDSQNRLLALEEMFRGTLTQTSVYPVKWCCAPAPSGRRGDPRAQPPQRQRAAQQRRQALTATLKAALALIDVRVLDHIIVGPGAAPMAEEGYEPRTPLAGSGRHLPPSQAAREQAELSLAQAEACAARERERNLFALSVGKVTPLRARKSAFWSHPRPCRCRWCWTSRTCCAKP
jgi:hypothetical protein